MRGMSGFDYFADYKPSTAERLVVTPFALFFLLALAGSSCFALGRALGRGERYEKGYREGFRDGETGSLARAARPPPAPAHPASSSSTHGLPSRPRSSRCSVPTRCPSSSRGAASVRRWRR